MPEARRRRSRAARPHTHLPDEPHGRTAHDQRIRRQADARGLRHSRSRASGASRRWRKQPPPHADRISGRAQGGVRRHRAQDRTRLVAVNLKNEDGLVADAFAQLKRAHRPTRASVRPTLRSWCRNSSPTASRSLPACSRDPDFGCRSRSAWAASPSRSMRDFALRMLPLREGDAEAMIAETRGAALLGAVRGGKAADIKSLAACLYALADFACEQRRPHRRGRSQSDQGAAAGTRLRRRRRLDRRSESRMRADDGLSAPAQSWSSLMTARPTPSTTSPSTSRAASSSRFSVRAAPARRRRC